MSIGRDTKRAFDADRRALNNAFGNRGGNNSSHQKHGDSYRQDIYMNQETNISSRVDDERLYNERLRLDQELQMHRDKLELEKLRLDNEFFSSPAGRYYAWYHGERNREVKEYNDKFALCLSNSMHNKYLSRVGIIALFIISMLLSVISKELCILVLCLFILYSFIYTLFWAWYRITITVDVKVRPDLSRHEAMAKC